MRTNRWLTPLTVLLFASAPQAALALPFVGQSAIYSGFGADDGTELWMPEPLGFAIELFDLVGEPGDSWLSTFGFYYAAHPANLIPIFSATDQDLPAGGDLQTALVNFVSGAVVDLDDGVLETTFTPAAGPIGFFYVLLSIVDPSNPVVFYTQPGLNTPDVDTFGTFRSLTEPNKYRIGAEIDGRALVLNVVGGINPVPEPTSGVLFMAGGLVVAFTLRKTARRS
jgi:hypothetical protein